MVAPRRGCGLVAAAASRSKRARCRLTRNRRGTYKQGRQAAGSRATALPQSVVRQSARRGLSVVGLWWVCGVPTLEKSSSLGMEYRARASTDTTACPPSSSSSSSGISSAASSAGRRPSQPPHCTPQTHTPVQVVSQPRAPPPSSRPSLCLSVCLTWLRKRMVAAAPPFSLARFLPALWPRPPPPRPLLLPPPPPRLLVRSLAATASHHHHQHQDHGQPASQCANTQASERERRGAGREGGRVEEGVSTFEVDVQALALHHGPAPGHAVAIHRPLTQHLRPTTTHRQPTAKQLPPNDQSAEPVRLPRGGAAAAVVVGLLD